MAGESVYELVKGFLEQDDWLYREVAEGTAEVRVRGRHTGHIVDIYCEPEDRFIRMFIDSRASISAARGS